MTDRDPDTGQFTESSLGHNPDGAPVGADYVAYDDGASEPDELSLDDARDMINSWDDEELAKRQNIEGGPITLDDLPENVSLTQEQGEKILLDTEAARQADADQKEADELRNAIDELRSQDKSPEEPPRQTEEAKALENLAIQQAADKAAEAERSVTEAQTNFVNGLAIAIKMAEDSFFERHPDFNGVPPDQRFATFMEIQRNDPLRAMQIRADVDTLGAKFQHYEQESKRLEAQRVANLQSYARAESAKFEESIKDTPKAERAEIEKAVVGAIGKAGGSTEQFASLMKSSEFASATVQKMLWDYGRLLVKEARMANIPQPRPVRNVPTVLKPGTSSGKSVSELSVEAAERRMIQTGSEADGWAFLQAKMRARG